VETEGLSVRSGIAIEPQSSNRVKFAGIATHGFVNGRSLRRRRRRDGAGTCSCETIANLTLFYEQHSYSTKLH
jgi:hypothetical protein